MDTVKPFAGTLDIRNAGTGGADGAYLQEMVQFIQQAHLAGEFVPLSELLIEPRFVPLPRPADPEAHTEDRDVYEIVPRVPDHPSLHAPYAIETLSLDELATGARALAILGEPGSGRTTALLAIALLSLGQLDLKPLYDKIQQKLDADEARLNERDRSVRIKERTVMQQRARERLATAKGEDFDPHAPEPDAPAPPFRRLLPIYVHLADLILTASEYGPEIDPAEPLVRAAQSRLKALTAVNFPKTAYQRLNRGTALLLIDGYDDLPESDRAAAADWLRALTEMYGDNFIIAAGPVSGYGALMRAGMAPVFVRPWSDGDVSHAAARWADAWAQVTKGRKSSAPDASAFQGVVQASRGYLPAEISLHLWAALASDATQAGVEGWLQAYLLRHLPPDLMTSAVIAQMAQLAASQLDDGYITVEQGVPDRRTTQEMVAVGQADAAQARLKFIASLRQRGLLVRCRGDRFQFRHALLAQYLASLTLTDADDRELIARSRQRAWNRAVAYTALRRHVEPAVEVRLKAPADLLHAQVTDLARWLAYAPANIEWRGSVLKLLGNLLMSVNQYPVIRERAAAALVTTRSADAFAIFRRAVRMDNADTRRLGCLGMGALGNPESIRDLVPLLNDQHEDVQIAAAIALSAIPTEEALEAMLIAFTEGAEQVRQALAIAFSTMPEDGYPILHESITDEDMMIRRAAVFGLRRLKTTWAQLDIYHAFLEDTEWYVRSAAQHAFQEMQLGRVNTFTTAPIPANRLTWLAEWAEANGIQLPPGDGAHDTLARALQAEQPAVRTLSAQTLALLGRLEAIKPLYDALRDRHGATRAAAFAALSELQLQMGRSLPATS